jgi:uncharacterized protein (DUF885 family)
MPAADHDDADAAPDRSRRALLVAALAVGAGAVLLPACAQPTPPWPSLQAFDAWAEGFVADWMRLSPERVTATQYFAGIDDALQASLDRQLSLQTAERRRRQRDLAHAGLQQLARFDATLLTPRQRTEHALLRWSFERSLALAPFEDHGFVFGQTWGLHLTVVQLLTVTQPLQRPEHVDAHLARLAMVAPRIDEGVARARDAARRGLVPPRFIAARVREQVAAFLAPPVAGNELVTALARRIVRIPGLEMAAQVQATGQAAVIVEREVRPAYARLLAFLDELLPTLNDDAGLWRLPDGDAAYAQALAGHTTTALSADAIHAIGLREVARLEGEMDGVLRSLGRTEGSVRDRITALRRELQPPADPDPRAMLLARYAEHVRDAQQRAQALFNLRPAAPVEVRRVPALTERSSSAYYTTPAPDGSLPGIFWVPLPGPTFNTLGMRSLAVHEAVPGHHFQLALQQEQTGLPRWRQRRVFGGGSAHSEGWALYAERLAIDHGWYDGDPHGLLGALDAQLFRARRLVVDTGLHARRWTRQQAIDYGIGAAEVDRYVVNPGQACAYMIGMLELLAQRERARTALGARFDLKAFHDVVLKTGSVPLDVLGGVVERWAAGAGPVA